MSINTATGGGDESSKRKREPNFNKWEDLTLCKCYINTTCDPTVGNNQKGIVCWRKVHDKFALVHSQTHISIKQHEHVRLIDQLMNRFNRNIKVDIVVYNKHYFHIMAEKPSGVPVEQYPELICTCYKEVEGKPFRFAQCVDTLHSVPKFSPDSTPALIPGLINNSHDDDDDDDDDDDLDSFVVVTESVTTSTSTPSSNTTNMVGSVMGSNMRRPIGGKRAKAAAAAARSERNNSAGEPEVVDLYGATSLSSTAAEMAANFSEMNSNNKKKDAFDMKIKEFEMKAKVFDVFMSLGKKEVAEKVADTLQQYCNDSSTTSVVPPQKVQEVVEEVAEEEEEEDTGSPDLGWAQNEEEDQEEGHGKSGDTGDTESVGSETVLNEPPPHQATFLSSGFGTQALMETQSRFTDRRMPPEGHDLLPRNSSELEAEWHQTRGR
jgi:hypothetical protein